MGALTSKKKEFAFRNWEQKSFKELDDTEVLPFRVRVEKLKTKSIRILPINYWIADKKRFANQKELVSNPVMLFEEIKKFKLITKNIKEQKLTQYLVSNVKAYKKILDKITDKNTSTLSLFLGKKLSKENYNHIKAIKKNINLYSDLLLGTNKNIIAAKNTIITENPSAYFEKIVNLAKNKEAILLTNPRLDSPAFNAYIYQHTEEMELTSFSAFKSNLKKKEIPFTINNVMNSIQGNMDLSNKLIIGSLFTPKLSAKFSKDAYVNLMPIYLQTNLEYNDPHKNLIEGEVSFNLSSRKKQNYKFFVSTLENKSKDHNTCLALPAYNNIFDRFFLKKINQKFLSRLFLLYFLIIPEKALITKKFIEKRKESNLLLANTTLTVLQREKNI